MVRGPTVSGLVFLSLTGLITVLQPSRYAWVVMASAVLGVVLLALAERRERPADDDSSWPSIWIMVVLLCATAAALADAVSTKQIRLVFLNLDPPVVLTVG
jgi:peptidoglycan biosynthesis protein MviN/MurJ (putative lipid II flippase)